MYKNFLKEIFTVALLPRITSFNQIIESREKHLDYV